MTDSVLAYSVSVGGGTWADTVRDVIPPMPLAVDDSTVVGLQASKEAGEWQRLLFRVRRGGGVETFPLPTDLLYIFTDVALSPQGHYLAYVAKDSVAGLYATVNTFPGGNVLVRGPIASGCDCDVDLNHARWLSADSFEIAVVNTAAGHGWQIVAGNAAAARLHVTSLSEEPAWHASR